MQPTLGQLSGADLMNEYMAYDPRADLKAFTSVPTEDWLKMGEARALEAFRLASQAVPAYKDFLRKHSVNPEKIQSIQDFKSLPETTKENYFECYPLSSVVVGGDLSAATVIHYSSGSSGRSFYWPKSVLQDINGYKGTELLLTQYFDADTVPTLALNCLSMGAWAAGELVHASIKAMASKGRPITVMSPGLSIDLFCRLFTDLAPCFEQVILVGYPSFLRVQLQEACARGIEFRPDRTKIWTGGEGFSEPWREYMAARLNCSEPYKLVSSVLGTSETGLTGMSTPFCDYLRILLYQKGLSATLFSDVRLLPCVIQYLPAAKYIEILDGEIVVTCGGLVPLIRYGTKDRGVALTPAEILSRLPGHVRGQLESLRETCGIPNLPVLAIYGRSDASVFFYAASIYPDQIADALTDPDAEPWLTGRFVVSSQEDDTADQYLQLTVELKSGACPSPTLEPELRQVVSCALERTSPEYASILGSIGEKAKVRVELREYNPEQFLLPSGKAATTERKGRASGGPAA